MAPVSGVGPAAAIDGRGKVAAGSVAALEEDASLSAFVTRRGVDGSATVVAVAVVVVVVAATTAASASAREATAAVGDMSPVDAI